MCIITDEDRIRGHLKSFYYLSFPFLVYEIPLLLFLSRLFHIQILSTYSPLNSFNLLEFELRHPTTFPP